MKIQRSKSLPDAMARLRGVTKALSALPAGRPVAWTAPRLAASAEPQSGRASMEKLADDAERRLRETFPKGGAVDVDGLVAHVREFLSKYYTEAPKGEDVGPAEMPLAAPSPPLAASAPGLAAYAAAGPEVQAEAERLAGVYAASPAWLRRETKLEDYLATHLGESLRDRVRQAEGELATLRADPTYSAPANAAAADVPEVAAYTGPARAEARRLAAVWQAGPAWVRETPLASYLSTQMGAPAPRKG